MREARTARRVANERLGAVQHAEQIAQRNLDRSIDAIDQMLVRIGSERLNGIPQMTPVRRDILEDAKKRIEAMLAEDPTSTRLRYQLAKTQLLLGYVYVELEQWAKARPTDREAVSAVESLLAEDPENREYKLLLSQALCHLAWTLGPMTVRVDLQKRALAIRKSLFERFPEDVQVRHELMMGYNALATNMQFVNPREAEELLREAIQLGSDSRGADRVAIMGLADAFHIRGQILTKQFRFDEAAPAFECSLSAYHQFLAAEGPLPDDVDLAQIRMSQAQTCNEFADLLATSQPAKSEKLRLELIDQCKQLVIAFPEKPRSHVLLGEAQRGLYTHYCSRGRLAEAAQLISEVEPQSGLDHIDWAKTFHRLGQDDKALEECDRALKCEPADLQVYREAFTVLRYFLSDEQRRQGDRNSVAEMAREFRVLGTGREVRYGWRPPRSSPRAVTESDRARAK